MRVKANGIEMSCEISGKAGAPMVVMSHSLGSSLRMWEPQLPVLEPEFRVLRYDTRGHGGTEATRGAYTLDQLGDDAIGLLDALKIEKVHFVGISMGGMIGQNLGLRYPGRVESLCLCATAAIIPEDAQPIWQERIEAARGEGMGALVDAAMERWFTADFRNRKPRWLDIIRRQFTDTPVAGFIGCSEAIRRLNYRDRLPEIRIPTLIVAGAEDLGIPVSASEEIHRRIAGSKLVVIPSAAHLCIVEQPVLFNEAMMEFLRERG